MIGWTPEMSEDSYKVQNRGRRWSMRETYRFHWVLLASDLGKE